MAKSAERVRKVILGESDNAEHKSRSFSISRIPANGDCFYAATNLAISEIPDQPSGVDALRRLVSSQVTDETLAMMKHCHDAGIEGYDFMGKVTNIDELKSALCRTGRNAGVADCVWADGFAIQTISSVLGLSFIIVDEASRGLLASLVAICPEETVSQPCLPSTPGAAQLSAGCTRHRPLAGFCTLLLRSRRLHYDLISLDGRGISPISTLNSFPEVFFRRSLGTRNENAGRLL